MINYSLSKKVHGSLDSIMHKCNIFNTTIEQFKHTISSLKRVMEKKEFKKVKELLHFVTTTNRHNLLSSNKVLLHFQNLVCLSKSKQNTIVRKPQKFDIKDTVLETIESQKYQAESNGTCITTHFFGFPKKNTGEVSLSKPNHQIEDLNQHEFTIASDEQRIRQILLSLQENAIQYTPSCGSIYILC
jgi:signal transduction histidine kinase